MIYVYRSIDSHTLIGNIGGYIGLCLGYNFLQIPALITIILRAFKGYVQPQKLIKNSSSVSKSLGTIEKKSNDLDEEQNDPKNDDGIY